MATNDPNPQSPFSRFMAAVQRPVSLVETPAVASPATVESLDLEDFDEFAKRVEEEYAQIMVPVSSTIVAAHQKLVDCEIANAESNAMRAFWAAKRAPNMHEGVASISLGDALEAYDYLWADRNDVIVEHASSAEDRYSPRCNRYYDAVSEMIQKVWTGQNADHLLKTIETALFSPDDAENVVLGKHRAKETAINLLDFAHAVRVDMKGPNRTL